MKIFATALVLAALATSSAQALEPNCPATQLNLSTERALRDVQVKVANVCALSVTQRSGIVQAAHRDGSFSDMRRRVKSIVGSPRGLLDAIF